MKQQVARVWKTRAEPQIWKGGTPTKEQRLLMEGEINIEKRHELNTENYGKLKNSIA